mmetsp:Transcript_1123/g.1730  ORF Transcript_1123/g.1730 Transcript_1123/m.1730 type:complete len:404 (-) Transcript_1123:202-1413(-)
MLSKEQREGLKLEYASNSVIGRGIILLGKSQVGKTQLKRQLGDSFSKPNIGSLFSQTQKASVEELLLYDNTEKKLVEYILRIVDSCGLFETNRGDKSRNTRQLLDDIQNCLQRDIREIHVLGLVIKEGTPSLEDIKSLIIFLKNFSVDEQEGCKKVLVLTHCDKITDFQLAEKLLKLKNHSVLKYILSPTLSTHFKFLKEDSKGKQINFDELDEDPLDQQGNQQTVNTQHETIKDEDISQTGSLDELVDIVQKLNVRQKMEVLGIGSVDHEEKSTEKAYETDIQRNERFKNQFIQFVIDANRSTLIEKFPLMVKQATEMTGNIKKACDLLKKGVDHDLNTLFSDKEEQERYINELTEARQFIRKNPHLLLFDQCKEQNKELKILLEAFKNKNRDKFIQEIYLK